MNNTNINIQDILETDFDIPTEGIEPNGAFCFFYKDWWCVIKF